MILASLGSAEPCLGAFEDRELGLWEQGWQYSPLGMEVGMWIWVTASAARRGAGQSHRVGLNLCS